MKSHCAPLISLNNKLLLFFIQLCFLSPLSFAQGPSHLLTIKNKDTLYVPIEQSTKIYTIDKHVTVNKKHGNDSRESREEIHFDYTYDKQGNWILKNAFRDNQPIYQEKRILDYYQ